MSPIRHKADNATAPEIVRYWTKADKVGFGANDGFPLMTPLGHGVPKND